MKHLKNPTREQKKLIQQKRLNPSNWMIERDTPEQLVIVHRHSDKTIRTIHKEPKE